MLWQLLFQRSVANAQGTGIRCRCKAAMTMYYAVEQKSNRHEVRGVLSKETGRYGPVIGHSYSRGWWAIVST